jgi:hypothetical protein
VFYSRLGPHNPGCFFFSAPRKTSEQEAVAPPFRHCQAAWPGRARPLKVGPEGQADTWALPGQDLWRSGSFFLQKLWKKPSHNSEFGLRNWGGARIAIRVVLDQAGQYLIIMPGTTKAFWSVVLADLWNGDFAPNTSRNRGIQSP